MTESIFIALHANQGVNVLNQMGRLHLNVNPVDISTTTQGVVTGVVVHVNAQKIDGVTISNSPDENSIEAVLEQVETIRFNFNGTLYTLVIENSTFYSTVIPFFYFQIEPIYIDDVFDANAFVHSLEEVTFTPHLTGLSFEFTDSNPLFSNASNQRRSTLFMESERVNSTVEPANIQALLDEQANLASVQDSLYYDTGWSKARYRGSKTFPADNAGIPPSISGRSFFGEAFSTDTTTDYICQNDNRIQQEFFHDGNTQLPTFTLSTEYTTDADGDNPTPTPLTTISSELLGGSITNDTPETAAGSTVLFHNIIDESKFEPLAVGDIITLNPFDLITGVEYMRVTEVTSTIQIKVKRDIYRSRKPLVSGFYLNYSSTPVPAALYRLEEYVIYRLDETELPRLKSVGTQRIYVEGSNSIIELNKEGALVSQSFCPVFINYIE